MVCIYPSTSPSPVRYKSRTTYTTNLSFRQTDRPPRYKPAPKMLGWQIGFWNLIGGIGFTVCPAVGFGAQNSAALEYASGLSTFIGSWAFLVSHWHDPFSPPPYDQVH